MYHTHGLTEGNLSVEKVVDLQHLKLTNQRVELAFTLLTVLSSPEIASYPHCTVLLSL